MQKTQGCKAQESRVVCCVLCVVAADTELDVSVVPENQGSRLQA